MSVLIHIAQCSREGALAVCECGAMEILGSANAIPILHERYAHDAPAHVSSQEKLSASEKRHTLALPLLRLVSTIMSSIALGPPGSTNERSARTSRNSQRDAQVLGSVCRFRSTHRDMLGSSLRLVSSANVARGISEHDIEEVSLILSILLHASGDADLLLRYLDLAVLDFDSAVYECVRDICAHFSSSSLPFPSIKEGATSSAVATTGGHESAYWRLLRLAVGYCEKRTLRGNRVDISPGIGKAGKTDAKLQEFEIEVIVSCIEAASKNMLHYFPVAASSVSSAAPTRSLKEQRDGVEQRALTKFCLENSVAVLYCKVRALSAFRDQQRKLDVLTMSFAVHLFGHHFGKSDKRSALETNEQTILHDPSFAFVVLLLRKTRDLHYGSPVHEGDLAAPSKLFDNTEQRHSGEAGKFAFIRR